MFIKNYFTSLLVTTILATTASFANYPSQADDLDGAAPAIAPLVTTPPYILRELSATLEQFKTNEATFQANQSYLIRAFSLSLRADEIQSSRTLLDKNFRIPVLRQKFQDDARVNLNKKQSSLYTLIRTEQFDADIKAQVLASLKKHASTLDYKALCRSYQSSYVTAMLDLDPVRANQHRKFTTFSGRLTDALSSKVLK